MLWCIFLLLLKVTKSGFIFFSYCSSKTEEALLIRPNFRLKTNNTTLIYSSTFSFHLSSEFWARQAQREVVKIKNLDFSYWAWSTPWGHVLSLKKFCRNPALSWAISYSVFQPVKFTSSFEFVCGTLFSTFWHLILKFGYFNWFLSNKISSSGQDFNKNFLDSKHVLKVYCKPSR